MCSKLHYSFSIILLLCLVGGALGQPVPVWHNKLDDMASSTTDGGQVYGSSPTFPPGIVSPPLTTVNKLQSTGDSRLFWGTSQVQNIFGSWNDADGITVDLYFSGFGPGVDRDSGLWSVGHRVSDNFFIIAVRDDTLRINVRNDSDSPDSGTTHTIQTGNLGLIAGETYRLTVRQHTSLGNDGDLEVYLDDLGGNAYSNDTPLGVKDLPTGYYFNFPLETGSGPALGMSIGNRHPFATSSTVLKNGEAIDEIRIFNGNFTPAELDFTGPDYPSGDINQDRSVDYKDVDVMTDNWLFSDCNVAKGNLDEKDPVNLIDFAIMANDWLTGALVTITQQPADLELYQGSQATFSVAATGAKPITYQWQKEGIDLCDCSGVSGATTDTLQIANIDASDAGSYRCVVMNNYSTVISDEATLTVVQFGDIGVSPSGHYVTYKDEVLMLIGDSGTQCAAQNSNLEHRQWIDDCASRGIRAIHVWSFVPVRQKQDGSQIEERWGYVIPDVMPWARKTSGPLAYDQRYQWDLRAFDEGSDGDMNHYWPRMRDMCSYAKAKNMLVGITMFTGWSKHDYSWVFHPLNVTNGGHLTNKSDAVTIASPGTEVWEQAWSDGWSNAKKTQWVWEQLSIKFVNELGPLGNVFFVFFDEHSYSEGNMGDHFLNLFRTRGQIWVDWNNRRPSVAWVMSGTLHSTDKNSDAVSGFNGSPNKPYLNLEGEPYMGDGVRTGIWTFSIGGGHYFFHADAGQETDQTGIMGYDPYVPGGDKGMYKRDWLGHASRFFNEHVADLDTLVAHNELSGSGTYCLAEPGREYVVYSKIGSSTTFNLNLSAAVGKTLNCRFYNPRDGQFESTFQRTGGSSSEPFTKPDTDDWVLHIVES